MNKKIRKEEAALEKKIRKSKIELAKLRAKKTPEPVNDYVLTTLEGKPVKLSSLFGAKKELILIHNMGASCPYCTLWGDGFNGLLHHLEDRAAFVVETPEKFTTISKFKKNRGWKFKMVSSLHSSFRLDMGYADHEGSTAPGVTTFIRRGAKIFRLNDTEFGPGDNYCSAWDLFDLLQGKSLNWEAKFKY